MKKKNIFPTSKDMQSNQKFMIILIWQHWNQILIKYFTMLTIQTNQYKAQHVNLEAKLQLNLGIKFSFSNKLNKGIIVDFICCEYISDKIHRTTSKNRGKTATETEI